MSKKPLAVKMRLKPGTTFAAVHVPDTLHHAIDTLAANMTVAEGDTPAAVILVFVADRADAEILLPVIKARLLPPGTLWAAFRKGNATGIDRDSLFTLAGTFGLQPCANIAIDDVWSALRFKVIA